MTSSTTNPDMRPYSGAPVFDSKSGYGSISRAFHWSMAFLFLLQLATVVLRVLAEDTPLERFFWPVHTPVGIALMGLVLLRGLWAILNLYRRPVHPKGFWSHAAHLGHGTLYALMIAVPAIAILRSYGSGRGLDFLGVEILARTGTMQAAWMDRLGDALHGELGWALFAVVGVHILAAVLHPRLNGHAVMPRMGVTAGPGTKDRR